LDELKKVYVKAYIGLDTNSTDPQWNSNRSLENCKIMPIIAGVRLFGV